MTKDYIEIAGRRYRVEVNWNATTAYLQAVGRDTLDELAKIDTFRPSELTALMAACIAEGERLEGNQDVPSALDLGAVITPAHVAEFLKIYVRQSAPQVDIEDVPKKEEREEEPGL
jgi:hypothetical protein